MSKKARKTIKYSLITLLFALFLASVSAFAATYFRARDEKPVPFSQKIVYSVKGKVQDGVSNDEVPENSAITVMLQYAETFTCKHVHINSQKELDEHLEELRAYYTENNAKLVAELDFSDSVSASYSYYGPFIEYRYDSEEDFFAHDYEVLESCDNVYLEKVYVEDCDFSDDATRNSGRDYYTFFNALNDIGVTNRQYTGASVKVGIVESGVPNNTVNLESGMYETYGTTLTAHSFQTSSIIGAKTGIANDAKIYFAALSDYSFVSCCNWFIGNGVNVINRSNGGGTGTYNSASAYADYVVKETKITFINSAGNDGDTNLSGYPGTGVNVISVASTDWNKAVSSFSSAGMQDGQTISLAKPTLAAPGGSIYGIPNVSGAISGTSFSAPMVTGVVTLLMDEFPQLKLHPEMVMALLTNTCTPAEGQTEIWDHDAGFGIVNYRRARAYMSNTYLYEISGTATANSQVMRHYVTLPAGAEIKANVSLLLNSKQKDQNSLLPVTYTKLRLAVMDNGTGKIVTSGATLSNYSYLTFTNTTGQQKSYSLCVYLDTAKTLSETEQYAIHYITEESLTSKLSVGLYRNGEHVYGGNFVSAALVDTGITYDLGDTIRIEMLTDESIGCNYTPNSTLVISLENYFYVGETRITFCGNNFQVELIIHVQANVEPPRLIVDGKSYNDGAIVRVGSKTTVGWDLACDYGDATAHIVSTNYNRTFNCQSLGATTLTGTAGKTETYTVTLTDDFGNVSTFTVIIDSEAPSAKIYKVFQNRNYEVPDGSRLNVPFYVSFIQGEETAVYRLNGGSAVRYYGGNLSADGTYEFTVTDSVGNATRRTVTVDCTAPVLNIGLSIFGVGETNFTVTADSGKELEQYFLTGFTLGSLTDADADAEVEVEHDGRMDIYTKRGLPVSFTESGGYSIRVYDTFGNDYSFNLLVLGDEPEIVFAQVGETLKVRIVFSHEFEYAQYVAIFRNDEAQNGVSAQTLEYTFALDGRYTVVLQDNVGRFIERTYIFQKAAPAGELIGVANGGIAARDVTLLYDSAKFDVEVIKDGEVVTNYADIGAKNLQDEGSYKLTVYYLNDRTNFTVYTFSIDKSAPEITAQATVYGSEEVIKFNSAQELLNANLRTFKSFAVTSLTDASAMPILEVMINGEVRRYFGGGSLPTLSAGGIYGVNVYDACGTGYNFTVTIAGREPRISFEENSENSSLSVNIDFEQTFTAATELNVYKDGSMLDGASADVLTYTFYEDGEYTVSVLDDAGRETESTYNYQKRAPQGTVSGVRQSGKTKGTVRFTYDKTKYFAQVYLNGVLVSSDNVSVAACAGDCSVDEAQTIGVISLTEDGNYEVRLLYINDHDNYVVYKFEIDTTAPQIQLNGCAEGKTVGRNVRVFWQDKDVASATYSLNGGAEKAFTNDREFSAEGIYTVTLKDDLDNVSKATFGIDKTAPEVAAKAWVYGESEQRQIVVDEKNSGKIMNLFCESFEISEFCDALSASYIQIMFNGSLSSYESGEQVPRFEAAGVYNVLVSDYLKNCYMMVVNIIGGAPQVTFTQSEDETSFSITVDIDVRTDLVASIDVFKDGERIDGNVREYNYSFEKDGEYTVIVREYFNRVVEMSFGFEKPLPEGELTGVADGGITNCGVSFEFGDAFVIVISMNGEQLDLNVDGTVDFTDDGEYTVTLYYKSDAASFRTYSFVIDTVAPEMQLTGVENGGTVRNSVVISEVEEGSTVEVYKDGELVDFNPGEEIKDAGEYEVHVMDAAGNVTVYSFTIERLPMIHVVLMLVGSFAAVFAIGAIASAVVLIIKKKKHIL